MSGKLALWGKKGLYWFQDGQTVGAGGDTSVANGTLIISAVDGSINASAAVTFVNVTATGNTALGDAVTDTLTVKGASTIMSTSASAFTVGAAAAGATPAFAVDASTASQVTGLKVIGAATGGTVAVSVTQASGNANLSIDAIGSGTITLNGTATGGITLSRAVTCSSTTSLVGAATVTATGGLLSTVSNLKAPFFPAVAQDTPAPAAAIPLTTYLSTLNSTAGATTQTLAASTVVGQVKKIQMIVDGGDDVVTVTSLSGGTTITFADVGDVAELMWNGTNWVAIALYNIADGATAPVLA